MHREKRETRRVFCPSQSARKSTRAGRIEWPASHAFVVGSVNRMFVRTNGIPRDEIGTTACAMKRKHAARSFLVEPLNQLSWRSGDYVSVQRFKASKDLLTVITSRNMRRLSRKKLTLLPSA